MKNKKKSKIWIWIIIAAILCCGLITVAGISGFILFKDNPANPVSALFASLTPTPTITPSQTPTLTPSPTPSQTPTITPSSTPTFTPTFTFTPTSLIPHGSKVVYKNDFSSDQNGFPPSDDDYGTITYQDGKLTILPFQAELKIGTMGFENYDDIIIDVDVDQVTKNGLYGIACRVNPVARQGYEFVIDMKGSYGIFRTANDSLKTLLEYAFSDKFPAPPLSAHITVACVGNQFTLAVNHQLIAQVTDNSYRAGSVALYAYARTISSSNPFQVSFDNLEITEPSE